MPIRKFNFESADPLNFQAVERLPGATLSSEEIIDALIGHFCYGSPRKLRLWQYPSMGRACYVANEGAIRPPFVGAKGIGIGPAAEYMERYWDHKLRRLGGGVIRLSVAPCIPYDGLYVYKNFEQYTVTQAIPVGRSAFISTAVDFALSQCAYEPLRIRSARAVALLRCRTEAPWARGSANIHDWICARASLAIRGLSRDSKASIDTSRLNDLTLNYVDPSSPSHLDLGLLIREIRSSLSLQDIYSPAARGLWSDVAAELATLGECDSEHRWSATLLEVLARSAGLMVSSGVCHRQLIGYAHYQDYSANGEVRDFDTTLVSRHINARLAQDIRAYLARLDPRALEKFDDAEKLFTPSLETAACYLVEMANGMFSTAMRFRDLSARARRRDNRPGTILPNNEINAARARFIKMMIPHLSHRGIAVFTLACEAMQASDQPLLEDARRCEGAGMPAGWSQPHRPFAYEEYKCTVEDLRAVRNEALAFAKETIMLLRESGVSQGDNPDTL